MKCSLNLVNVIPRKLVVPAAMAGLMSLPTFSNNLTKEDIFEKSNIKSEQADKTSQKDSDNDLKNAINNYNKLDYYNRSKLTYETSDSVQSKLYKMERRIDDAFANCKAYQDICIIPKWHYRYYPYMQEKLINFDVQEIRTRTDADMKSLQNLKDNIEYSIEDANGEKEHNNPTTTHYDIDELAKKHLGMSYADFDKEYHDELEFCKTVTYADFNSMSERQTFVYGKAKAYVKEMLETTINEARNTRFNYGERLLDETNKTSDDLSIITTFELDGINDDSWTKLKSSIVINSFKDVLKKNLSENKPNGINDLIVKPLTRKTIKKIENGKVIVITQNGLKYNTNGILK